MCSHCGPKTTDRERREKAAADRYPDRIGDTRQQREAKTGARVDFTIGADYEALHCAGEQTAARQYAEVWQREADSAFAREDEAHAECETYRAKVAVNIVEISGLRTELAEARREVGLAVQVLRAHTETEELSATPNESPYDVACAACSNLRALRTEVDRLTRERDELQRREDARSEAIEAYRRENERRAATVGIEAHELTDVVNLLFAKIDTLTRERDTLHARVAELEAVKIDGDRAALILFVAKAREQRDALRTEVDRLTRDNEALREALDEALKACGLCHGKGHYLTSCSMCHDSTWDHECDDERRECERCTRLLALLAPTPGSEKLV
jgi:chromosome segregation ATPase